MTRGMPRRDRLEELIDLAQAYRGLSRREVAAVLGRDLHNIVPQTGNPKLDLVVSLASALDWSVDMVVEELYDGEAPSSPPEFEAAAAHAWNRRAWTLLELERWDEVLTLTDTLIAARAPDESKAYATMVRFFALESQGRYLDAAESCRAGLAWAPLGSSLCYQLRERLAYACQMIGANFEAEGLASSLIRALGNPERSSQLRQVLAAAHTIRGHVMRAAATSAASAPDEIVRQAIEDLTRGAELYEDYAVRGGSERDAAVALTARGGVLELEALRGTLTPGEALERFAARLDGSEDLTALDSHAAESLGWWCVFGAHVALRHLADEAERQHWVAIFTTKADEIAQRLGHWALRERVLSIDHQMGVTPATEQTFDRDDVRAVTGTMSRFPCFRTTGWQILRARSALSEGAKS